MSDKYNASSRKELLKLVSLAREREMESKMQKVAQIVEQWLGKQIHSAEALQNIAVHIERAEEVWTNGVDPGVPVAHAVMQGYLKREDVSIDTWERIKMLVTLAQI